MTPEQYWHSSDCSLFWAYRVKFHYEVKFERNRDNFNAWLSGLYNLNAVVSAFNKNAHYFKEPIDFEEYERVSLLSDEEKSIEFKKKLEEKLKIQAEVMRDKLAVNTVSRKVVNESGE